MAKREKFHGGLCFFIALVCLVIGAVGGFAGFAYLTLPTDSDVYISGDLSIHFLELGNAYTGDSIFIKAGETDILIDAGSTEDSVETICDYVDQFCTDGILEYVIVTHAHKDHYAGFANRDGCIFDAYACLNIIDFAQTNQNTDSTSNMYYYYQQELQDEIDNGANHKTAKEVRESGDFIFDLGHGIEMEILDNRYYYETSDDENNYSVCVMFHHGAYDFLLTGDLEKEGEESLIDLNDLGKVALFKAGHHGSYTSSSEVLLDVIRPEIVTFTCSAGSDQYTSNIDRQFPSQDAINRIASYTNKVYVTTLYDENALNEHTSFNGNIVVTSSKNGVTVDCSNANTLLKDSAWFKASRICPVAWQ